MIFLKLGGSLITKKEQPQTPREEVISRLAREIVEARQDHPGLRLLIGHGSGSFGHLLAHQYQTHLGASSEQDWIGFAKVWAAANRLNRLVVDALLEEDLPVISMPPSASAESQRGKIQKLAVESISSALDAGLIPIVQGDVAFDQAQGSSILSTEEVFLFLATYLKPSLILLAGIEPGVYKNYPSTEEIIPMINDKNIDEYRIAPATATDVTGGMEAKVQQALSICRRIKGLQVRIFSGEEEGQVRKALSGAQVGTLIQTKSEI